MTDPKYHCSRGHTFTVRTHVAHDAQRTGRKINCPICGYNDAQRVGMAIRRSVVNPDAPPTEPQLNYIRALGGDTRGVKSMKDAGEYIGRLKKLQAAGT